MCPRQESNLHLSLRRAPFYPLNYKDIKLQEKHASVKGKSARRATGPGTWPEKRVQIYHPALGDANACKGN